MANIRWLGRAGAVAEVDTITIANTWAQNDTVTITINGKDLVITIGTLVTTSQVATTVKEAFNGETLTDTSASVVPEDGGTEFVEHNSLTATVASNVVSLTADTAGVPWNVNSGMAVTESTVGDGTATLANATAATGPNFADNTDNYDTGALPGVGDDLFCDNSNVSMLYGLSGLSGTLSSLNVHATYTGDIGLPKTNTAGYTEYRLDYLDVDVSAINIGIGEGSGSSRMKIDGGTVQTAIRVESTGSSAEVGLGAFIFKGTNASNTLRVQDGSVSIAPFGGESATLSGSVNVANGELFAGAGVTFSTVTLDIQAATVELRSNITTITQAGGTSTVQATATVGTFNVNGGTAIYKSSGTITAANVGGSAGGVLDLSQDNVARTITTLTINANGRFVDPLQTATIGTLAIGSNVRELVAT